MLEYPPCFRRIFLHTHDKHMAYYIEVKPRIASAASEASFSGVREKRKAEATSGKDDRALGLKDFQAFSILKQLSG